MIKKLLKLIINCILHPFTKYHWKELWYYLVKGYTSDDYTDLDYYLLKVVAQMGFDLAHHMNLGNDDILHMTPEAEQVLNLSEKARALALDMEYDILEPKEKQKRQKEFLKEFSKLFYNLWV